MKCGFLVETCEGAAHGRPTHGLALAAVSEGCGETGMPAEALEFDAWTWSPPNDCLLSENYRYACVGILSKHQAQLPSYGADVKLQSEVGKRRRVAGRLLRRHLGRALPGGVRNPGGGSRAPGRTLHSQIFPRVEWVGFDSSELPGHHDKAASRGGIAT